MNPDTLMLTFWILDYKKHCMPYTFKDLTRKERIVVGLVRAFPGCSMIKFYEAKKKGCKPVYHLYNKYGEHIAIVSYKRCQQLIAKGFLTYVEGRLVNSDDAKL